ncbi:MAG: sarcosine oxidase subunit gamma [Variibacter sp.]
MSEPAPAHTLTRRGPFAGRALETNAPGVTIADVGPCKRLILRGAGAAALAAGLLLNLDMPREAYGVARDEGGRFVLWLGPDEWLILAPEEQATELARALETRLEDLAHGLIDISQRDAGIFVRGPDAADVINAGCPLDLHLGAFPAGSCTRTLLGKAGIVLWRIAADAFRIETTRSFAPYVVALLQQAARDRD